MERTRTRLAAAMTAGALVMLTGCSGQHDTEHTPSGRRTTPSASAEPEAYPAGRIPAMADAMGALAALHWDVDRCGTGPGRQRVRGTVTNTTRRKHDYVVVVAWVADDGELRGRGRAIVPDLPPGRSADVSLAAHVGEGAEHCLPNVLQGRLLDAEKQ